MKSIGLKNIVFSSLMRRKARSFLLIFGLLVGVATVVALQATVANMQADIDRKMDEYGANMVVVPDSETLFLEYGGVPVSAGSSSITELTEEDAAKIWTIRNKENIGTVAPMLLGLTQVEGERAVLLGVSFPDAVRIRRWWEWRGHTPEGPNQIMIGSVAADKLNKEVGDRLEVQGQSMEITAVLESTGTQEDGYIFGELHQVQTMLGKPGKVSVIEISAWCSSCPIETLVLQTSMKLPQARVTAVKQAIATKADMLQVLAKFALAVSLAVTLVGSLIVLSTMMASVNERTSEIGILRAVGFRRSHIIRVILLEVVCLSLISGGLGFLAGTFVARLLTSVIVQTAVRVEWDLLLCLMALGLALGIGAVGGVYPAWRASRLDPVTALRSL